MKKVLVWSKYKIVIDENDLCRKNNHIQLCDIEMRILYETDEKIILKRPSNVSRHVAKSTFEFLKNQQSIWTFTQDLISKKNSGV